MSPSDAPSPDVSSSDAAALSSASSQLGDLIARVVEVANRYEDTDRDVLAHQLHEVERSLRMAGRQLDAAVRALGG
jgi:hypothetical protein